MRLLVECAYVDILLVACTSTFSHTQKGAAVLDIEIPIALRTSNCLVEEKRGVTPKKMSVERPPQPASELGLVLQRVSTSITAISVSWVGGVVTSGVGTEFARTLSAPPSALLNRELYLFLVAIPKFSQHDDLTHRCRFSRHRLHTPHYARS